MRRSLLLTVVVLVFAALGGYVIIWLHSMSSLGESVDSLSPSQIEAYAGIRIPVDASDMRVHLDQVITKRTLFIRFSLDSAKLELFLQDSPFHEPLSENVIPSLLQLQSRPDWFTPEHARQFLAGETARSAILVDTSASSRWVVYVAARS